MSNKVEEMSRRHPQVKEESTEDQGTEKYRGICESSEGEHFLPLEVSKKTSWRGPEGGVESAEVPTDSKWGGEKDARKPTVLS